MFFTLQRYVFREIFRIFILTTLALAVMINLALILQPVAEYGVGPKQVFHIMLYMLPISLTFVLPMAALFACTLVYGRFANDNEIEASKASGISLLTLINPGFSIALIVAIANLLLSFYVMPDFVERAEKALTADAKSILFRNLDRQGYYAPSDTDYIIYADRVEKENNMLGGISITELEGGKIERLIVTDAAEIKFNHHERMQELQVLTVNTYVIPRNRNIEQDNFTFQKTGFSIEFGSLLEDKIKFKKIDRMKKIESQPLLFSPVDEKAREAYARIITELLLKDMQDVFKGRITEGINVGQQKSFYRLYSGTKIVEISAGRAKLFDHPKTPEDMTTIEFFNDIVFLEYDALTGKRLRSSRCPAASLTLQRDESGITLAEDSPPTITFTLRHCNWQTAEKEEGYAARLYIRGLILPENVQDAVERNNLLKFLTRDDLDKVLGQSPTHVYNGLQNDLLKIIEKTNVQIHAEVHSRLVFGLGCLPMILIGIGLGIVKKGGHLLSAFGASCIPGALLIICIMGSKALAKNDAAGLETGIAVMWSGLGLLTMASLLLTRKLVRS